MIHQNYKNELSNCKQFNLISDPPWGESSHWLNAILIKRNQPKNIEELIGKELGNVGLIDIGRAKLIEDGLFRYVERVKSSFPSVSSFSNFFIVKKSTGSCQ